jgi:hypothetical protein
VGGIRHILKTFPADDAEIRTCILRKVGMRKMRVPAWRMVARSVPTRKEPESQELGRESMKLWETRPARTHWTLGGAAK